MTGPLEVLGENSVPQLWRQDHWVPGDMIFGENSVLQLWRQDHWVPGDMGLTKGVCRKSALQAHGYVLSACSNQG